jgi:hypothetical protein
MRKIKETIIILVTIFLFQTTSGQEVNYMKKAKEYFKEIDSICYVDNGRLWGVNLNGPTMFVIPENKLIIANQSDKLNSLKLTDGLFNGTLPDNLGIANTALDWNGVKWTMIMWNSISENDPYSRKKLFVHESWHRIQNELGISPVMTSNSHLDELEGSILLKLEFLALKNTLLASDDDKKSHLINALTIRKYRQLKHPKNNENMFERHEGMAEYTGFKLCGLDQNIIPKVIAKQLELSINKDGFANSFAYITGPAYGFILDGFSANWLEKILEGKSIPEIAYQIINTEISSDTLELKTQLNEIIRFYDAEVIVKNETEKFEQQHELVNEYRQKFILGERLIIPNNNVNFTFNPQEKLIALEDGVVYKTMRLIGEWGILEVSNGIFRSNDWTYFMTSAPHDTKSGTIVQPDYKLILNEDWEIISLKGGKYTLKKH